MFANPIFINPGRIIILILKVKVIITFTTFVKYSGKKANRSLAAIKD